MCNCKTCLQHLTMLSEQLSQITETSNRTELITTAIFSIFSDNQEYDDFIFEGTHLRPCFISLEYLTDYPIDHSYTCINGNKLYVYRCNIDTSILSKPFVRIF